MSALGHKQTYASQQVMSALPPIATAKADIRKRSCPLCPRKQRCAVHKRMSALGQKRTHALQQIAFGSSYGQLVQQRLGLFELGHVKAFRKRTVDRHEKVMSLPPFALIRQEFRKGVGRAQLQGPRRLISGYVDGFLKGYQSLWELTCVPRDFAANPMVLCLPEAHVIPLDHLKRTCKRCFCVRELTFDPQRIGEAHEPRGNQEATPQRAKVLDADPHLLDAFGHIAGSS